jgi:hypothetical protein
MKNVKDISRDVILEKKSSNKYIAALESDTGIFPIFIRFNFGDDGIADNEIIDVEVNGGSRSAHTMLRHNLMKSFNVGPGNEPKIMGRPKKPGWFLGIIKRSFRNVKQSGNFVTITINNFDEFRDFASNA